MQPSSPTNTPGPDHADCCVVGAGPGGAMLALLLARQGISVTLLESHMDFDRDFRGDTIHSAVLNIMDEIGLVDGLMQLPHSTLHRLQIQTKSGLITFSDYSWVKCKYPFEFLIAQSKFLEFVITEAKKFPSFRLIMGAQVQELLTKDGVVYGVHYQGQAGEGQITAPLVVAADGRFSRLRRLAGVEPITTSPPMDILWFRLSKKSSDEDAPLFHIGGGHVLFVVNRGDHWQIGYTIPKGGYQQVRAAGMEALQKDIARLVPPLADRVGELQEWKQIATLSVASDRLRRWYKPGLLFIGDAAHVMSPVGAVGINYAIFDAVVTSNLLGERLKKGEPIREQDLAAIQKEREAPTKAVQDFQNFIQKRIFAPALKSEADFDFPPMARLIFRIPGLRGGPTRLIAFGRRPVHVKGERPVR